MKVQVDGKSIEVEEGIRISGLLTQLGIQSETVFSIRDGKVLTSDEVISAGDEIQFKKVIAGG